MKRPIVYHCRCCCRPATFKFVTRGGTGDVDVELGMWGVAMKFRTNHAVHLGITSPARHKPFDYLQPAWPPRLLGAYHIYVSFVDGRVGGMKGSPNTNK